MTNETIKDNSTLNDKIKVWRSEYGQVFKTSIEDDIYIWRKLKRTEYKEITLALNQKYGDAQENAQFKTWERQDEIAKAVLLYPENVEEAIEESAGIATVISQDCLVRSGFGALTQQI